MNEKKKFSSGKDKSNGSELALKSLTRPYIRAPVFKIIQDALPPCL